MRLLTSLISITILTLFTACPAFAKTPIISTGEWAPFLSEKLPGGGPVNEIITASFKAEGVNVHFKYYPWKRAINMVQNGSALASSAWMDTAERRKFAIPSTPMVVSREVFIFMKKNLPNFDYTNLEALKKYRLASLAGYSHELKFREAGLNPESTNSPKSALRKLERDRIDLMCENEAVMAGMIKKMYPGRESEFGMSKKAFNAEPLVLLFSKKFPNVQFYVKKFDEGLTKIKQNGVYDRLAAKLK